MIGPHRVSVAKFEIETGVLLLLFLFSTHF